MLNLTEHERKVFELIQQHPEIITDRFAREEIATQNGMSEKTLRNRIGELKRFGLVEFCTVYIFEIFNFNMGSIE